MSVSGSFGNPCGAFGSGPMGARPHGVLSEMLTERSVVVLTEPRAPAPVTLMRYRMSFETPGSAFIEVSTLISDPLSEPGPSRESEDRLALALSVGLGMSGGASGS